ncbi:helix-turn-helix domain-containing protein [Halovivax cerinus]|uniref:Helix-turn-helix domain-containing protein n=1 Tax=Halovivax cerinus TaxID=1487865 RepID=A0ABD5NQN1_9EURY|nr:helix-turn-helix domain-containing protein [Halovivax cerinus]
MGPAPAATIPPGDIETEINQLATVGRLLEQPELARVYVYVCYFGPVTRPQIEDALSIPKTTVYDHVETLESLGVVDLDGDRPVDVTASPVRIDADGSTITPTILHAVARQEIDDDIAYFVERHGVGKLAAAVREAGRHYAGRITQRTAAEPLGVPTGEAIRIVLALEPVLAAGQTSDPHFDAMFPDIADEIDCRNEIDVSNPETQTE